MNIFIKKTKTKTGIKEHLWINFTHNGKRERKPLKLENTTANMKFAKKVIIPKLQAEILNGDYFKNKVPTVNDFVNKSFELQQSNRNENTQKDYMSKYIKHLKPVFGNKKLDEIKATDVTLWQNKMLKQNYEIKTIRNVRGILNVIFKDAKKDRLIDYNPIPDASELSTRGKSKNKKKHYPFTLDEIHQLLDNSSNNQMRNLYTLLFMTGLRGGEALGLKWSDIDFEKKEIDINCQITRGNEAPPKWESYREIPIIESLIRALQDQFKITGDKNSYVFLNNKGTHYWDISKVRDRWWKNDLKKANIIYRKIHETRHTFCSTLISNGEDVNYVSKIAGHSSTQMTLKTYSSYIPNKNQDFGKIFNINF